MAIGGRMRVVDGCGPRLWGALIATVVAVGLPVTAVADLENIRKSGVLRVGTSGDYPPFSRAEGGTFSGFDIELVTRLAKDLGVRVQYVRFRWPDLLQALTERRFDIAASGVTLRPERAIDARYARPYALAGATALIRREDAARFPDRVALDRAGVRIAVNRGGHLERVARRLFPLATIEPISENQKLPERVLGGTSDAALTDSAEVRSWARAELSTIGPFTRDRKAFLMRSDLPRLGEWIDEWLRERERDGWLARVREKWLGERVFHAAGADREAVLADVELRLGLMPAVGEAKRAAGLPIENPEQESLVLERARTRAHEVGISPEEVVHLLQALIHVSKRLQLSADSDARSFRGSLEQLRAAIARLDAHLIRQLRFAARTVKPDEWRAGLRETVDVAELSDSLRAYLAEAIAKTRTLRPPSPAVGRAPPAATPSP
jgi:cyclohexadienyl dehydratase